jgi:hypothetical protein
MTMALQYTPSAFPFLDGTDAPAADKPKSRLLHRLVAAIAAAQQRRADAEIARYLHGTGFKLTDSVERQITHRFL